MDGHYVMANQKVHVQMKMCDDNENHLIATLHSVLLAPDLCGGLLSNIMLMILVNPSLFHKIFYTL